MDFTKGNLAFLREYAALVRRHGRAFGYDGGWSTPEELWCIDPTRPEVAGWLDKLEAEGYDQFGNVHSLNFCLLD